MTIHAEALSRLVDWEHGNINPTIFSSREIYDQELEMVFGRAWLFLAHDSMIPNPGDFFSTYMGGDPVLVARQKDGSVKAFLNVCRHRGMKVCRAEQGNTNTFMCTYHGWTFDSSGALVSVPSASDAYYGELDLKAKGLIQVPQISAHKGLIFGNFDPTAPPLLEYLGNMTYYMDAWLDATPGGIEFLPGVVKWRLKGNWKMAAEQFAGDSYHGQVTHQSSFTGLTRTAYQGFQVSQPHGHGSGFRLATNSAGRSASEDALINYKQDLQEQVAATRGADTPASSHFTVFPNMSGLTGFTGSSVRVWHPKAPGQFEVWEWVFVPKEAPEEIRIALQQYSPTSQGPAGMVEIDDAENWGLISDILADSPQARKISWDYTMGVGHTTEDHPVYSGRIGFNAYGELPQRGFYRRWLDYMTSEEWPSIDQRIRDVQANDPERLSI